MTKGLIPGWYDIKGRFWGSWNRQNKPLKAAHLTEIPIKMSASAVAEFYTKTLYCPASATREDRVVSFAELWPGWTLILSRLGSVKWLIGMGVAVYGHTFMFVTPVPPFFHSASSAFLCLILMSFVRAHLAWHAAAARGQTSKVEEKRGD